MKNVYDFQPILATNFLTGTIIECHEGRFKVRTQAGLIPAQCAASCLLEPNAGDIVQLTADQTVYYMTAVLKQKHNESSLLNFSGDVAISAQKIKLQPEQALEIASKNVSINASNMTVKANMLNFVAVKLNWLATHLDMVAERIHRHAKREYIVAEQQHETITESKHSHAGRWFQRIRKQWISRSERTTLTSKKEVKIDGSRIDLG